MLRFSIGRSEFYLIVILFYRSLRAPPEVIRDILEGVLGLMGIQDTSWNSMKNFLAKRGVKDEIMLVRSPFVG